jgi:5'(3')-deoxyribonucleotidase
VKINHIFLDMDDVLCDFVGGVLRLVHREDALQHWPTGQWHIHKVLGIDSHELQSVIDHHGEHFWAGLKPLPWAEELVHICESFATVSIASIPSHSPYSAAGKLQWIERHFPKFSREYDLCTNKARLATDCCVLIDDNERNTDEFQEAGGRGVLFPQPWNSYSVYKNALDDRVTFIKGCLKYHAEVLAGSCSYLELLDQAQVEQKRLNAEISRLSNELVAWQTNSRTPMDCVACCEGRS